MGGKKDIALAIITMKEFKTYQKTELIKGRIQNLIECLGSYQNELRQGLTASGLGLLVSGVGLASQSNFIGFGGLGLVMLAGAVSCTNLKKIKEYKSNLQRSRTYLAILESSDEYQSLESKL